MHKIYLALGSNTGDREENIKKAYRFLSEKIKVLKYASVYESKAVGFTEQNNFLNTAIEAETNLTPLELLTFVKEIEKKVGRKETFYWGPREIDIDILFYDDLVFKNDILEIPHPLLTERDFVLIPLNEIAPNFIHPGLNKKISEILENFPQNKKSIINKNR
ncbi:MAG: 2-amino-4-hydroxy-6-hydroxymethyldihydropteridine diphosphokinase [Patescibacteria group bacterium]